ncbi:tripartite motif-containing protein 2-like [Mytilus edulis]|uniref:tripartite motif-containing protein 2-like n=1 Tax=Mytilus edulis TaxID=6550 RepID=UPI0039EFB74F
MASSKDIQCGPCNEGKVKNKADIWCYNCEEGLCSTCSGHHKRSKSSRDHKTIDIKSYKPSIQAIKTECDKHGQQLNLYCPSHLIPCCDECISTNHSKCTGIKSLAGVVEKTKIQKSKESVEKDINSILHLLDKIVNNKSTNIKTGEQQCEGIKESIVKIRNQINKYLDCLEEKLCKETDNIRDQEISTARDFISEVKGKKTKLKEMKEHLQTVTTKTSKLQSFLGVHQIEQQVHQCKQYVEDLENDERTKEFEIKMKQNDEIENILKKLGSLESMGEVLVVKTETDLKRETSVRKEAQVESREKSNINNMTMNIETKIEINMEKVISDMICLMDGRVILVEDGGKVNLLTSDGKLQKQLPIPGEALGVTEIHQNTIAITYPEEKAIKIFNMENETVTKVITLDKACKGLSFYNNSLAVGLIDDDEIRIVDLEGNTLKSIQVECESYMYHLVYCNDRVIYGDYYGGAVYCYDESGKQIWRYTQDLMGPHGLCTDSYGNIIVADYNSERIIVISKDGQDSKVLISNLEDGLKDLRCICFKHNESSGFICDDSGTYLAKFNLSYQ